MIRLRTLIAAALLTIPALTLSAATPADPSAPIMRKDPISAPQVGCCYWIAGIWRCFC
jgi:hypothetical protein